MMERITNETRSEGEVKVEQFGDEVRGGAEAAGQESRGFMGVVMEDMQLVGVTVEGVRRREVVEVGGTC